MTPPSGDMTRHVKLAFLNGMTECYVLRVADGADKAAVTLRAEDDLTRGRRQHPTDVLRLTARHPGESWRQHPRGGHLQRQRPRGNLQHHAVPLGRPGQRDHRRPGDRVLDRAVHGPEQRELRQDLPQLQLQAGDGDVTDPPRHLPSDVDGRAAPSTPRPTRPSSTAWDAAVTSSRNQISISVDGSPYVEVTLPSTRAQTPTTTRPPPPS